MNQVYNNVGYSLNQGPLTVMANPPVVALRAPTTNDNGYPIGQTWVYPKNTSGTAQNLYYVLTSVISNSANWLQLSGSGAAGVFSSLTVTPGPISLTGTTTINTSGSAVTSIGTGGSGAVNIGNTTGNTAVTGSLTASTTLTATLGNITATNGNLVLGTAGNKLSIATGSNASIGVSAAMTGGTVTVSTNKVTAQSIIFVSRNTIGGTAGNLSIANVVANTSFDIISDSGTETSTINWLIIN